MEFDRHKLTTSAIDPEAVRRWKAGMEEANRFALDQARNRTPAERFRNHQVFLEGNAQFGLAISKPEDRVHRMPYSELRERWLARYS